MNLISIVCQQIQSLKQKKLDYIFSLPNSLYISLSIPNGHLTQVFSILFDVLKN